jgi:hypothetical protein
MGISREFLPMMLETVTLRAQASIDKYGKQSFASGGTSFRARLLWDEKILRDKDGREIVETGRALLFGVAASVTPQWQITLPDGSTPKITTVDTVQDEDGDHHSVIGFGLG